MRRDLWQLEQEFIRRAARAEAAEIDARRRMRLRHWMRQQWKRRALLLAGWMWFHLWWLLGSLVGWLQAHWRCR